MKKILLRLITFGIFFVATAHASVLSIPQGGTGSGQIPGVGQVPIGTTSGTTVVYIPGSVSGGSFTTTSINGVQSLTFTLTGQGAMNVETINNLTKFFVATSSASVNGILLSSDWAIFNAKQNALTTPFPVASTSLIAGTGLSLNVNTLNSSGVLSVNGSTGTITGLQNTITFPLPTASTTQNFGYTTTTISGLVGAITGNGSAGIVFTTSSGAFTIQNSGVLSLTAYSTSGLTVSTATGTPAIALNMSGGTCSAGSHIFTLNATGTVICTTDAAGGSFTTTTINNFAGLQFTIQSQGSINSATSNSTTTFYMSTSTAAVNGILLATDWVIFNAKITTTSLSASLPLVYNNTSGAFSFATTTAATTTCSSCNLVIDAFGRVTTAATGTSGTFTTTTLNGFQALQFGVIGSGVLNSSTVNSTTTFSIATATVAVDGFLRAADFVIFNNKQPSITLATSGASGIVIASSSATWTFSQPTSTASVNGYLSAGDWTLFNAKISTTTIFNNFSGYNFTVQGGTGINSSAVNSTTTFSVAAQQNFSGVTTTYFTASNASTTYVSASGSVIIASTTGDLLASAFLQIGSSTASRAALNLASGTTVTASKNGDVWNDSVENVINYNTGGLMQSVDSTIFVQTASKGVVSTTTQTSLQTTGNGTTTIPANFLRVGKTINYHWAGFLSASSSGPGTLNIGVYLGSTVISSTTQNLASSTKAGYFEINGYITVRTTGATGTVIPDGYALIPTSTPATAPCASCFASWSLGTTTAITVDTTGALIFDVRIKNSVATSSVATSTIGVLKLLN